MIVPIPPLDRVISDSFLMKSSTISSLGGDIEVHIRTRKVRKWTIDVITFKD